MSNKVIFNIGLRVLFAINFTIFIGVHANDCTTSDNIAYDDLLSNITRIVKCDENIFREYKKYESQAAPDVTPRYGQKYDFIIVGAGTAGSTIASRLSELKNETVLLIEAGPEENLIENIPAIVLYLQLLPKINWRHKTQPSEKYCLSMNDHRCSWTRGKIMGGNSMLNYMAAVRCSPEDYDDWEKMGCTGWSWKDVFPYFKKIENMGIPELRDDKEVHNTDGPVPIQYPIYQSEGSKVFLEAAEQMGFPLVDYNDYRKGMGFSRIQATVMGPRRASSNRAYIRPVRCRTNLHVSKNSMVERILINKKRKRAIGVKFKKSRRTIKVYAKKEVIVSAGAIGSPQLLMLSGIGPAKHLTDKGIKVVKDLPGCGQNLMDHITFGGIVMTLNDSISIRVTDLINNLKLATDSYFFDKNGPLTSTGGIEAVGFVDTNNITNRQGRPNMQLLYLGGAISTDPTYQKCFNIQPGVWDHMFGDTLFNYTWSTMATLIRPKSRGSLKLASNDINDHPLIYANYMDHPDDVKTMIQGVRLVKKLSEQPAYQKYDSRLHDNVVPGCESQEYDSDDYWECAIRHLSLTVYHYSGTCKMGARDDPTAVVDPTLKVIGVEGLRVCDASIMPVIVSGNTNIPVYMIGEKCSDHVKQDYGYPIDPTSGPIDACDNDK